MITASATGSNTVVVRSACMARRLYQAAEPRCRYARRRRRRNISAPTTAAAAAGASGRLWVLQQPGRLARLSVPRRGGGLAPAAVAALSAAGSEVTVQRSSSATMTGRAGVEPPPATVTLHSPPSTAAVTVAL